MLQPDIATNKASCILFYFGPEAAAARQAASASLRQQVHMARDTCMSRGTACCTVMGHWWCITDCNGSCSCADSSAARTTACGPTMLISVAAHPIKHCSTSQCSCETLYTKHAFDHHQLIISANRSLPYRFLHVYVCCAGHLQAVWCVARRCGPARHSGACTGRAATRQGHSGRGRHRAGAV